MTNGSPEAREQVAGEAVAALIQDQLAGESARKTSLEARAVLLITSSGAFVTVLGAASTLTLGQDDQSIPQISVWLLVVSIAALFAAAVCGVYVNVPQDYTEASSEHLLDLAQGQWDADYMSASKEVAILRAGNLVTARRRNGQKAVALLVGSAAQVSALLLIGLSVAILVIDAA